ncbi:MAG: CYTH domain-containing protein [Roseiflexaceae bacterium]|nr:CYTH domain-containing protein [Roseiflexaceae bacterium]
MNIPREIEAKYAVADPRLFMDLLALSGIGPFTLAPDPEPIDQINTYFDTPDRRLRAARYGFRIRLAQGMAIATLKGPATIQDDIHTRSEWEAELTSEKPDDLPFGELRDRLLALTAQQPLLPTLSIRTNRHIIIAIRERQPIAEIALDDYVITAGSHQQRNYELELELLRTGQPDDLKELASLLHARYALVAESRSKLERGLALLEGAS